MTFPFGEAVVKGLRVGEHQYVIGDGAMATYLHQQGVPIHVCAEELNLSNPKLVEEVHKAYIDAGATLIQTNTFAANRRYLARYQLDGQMAEINRKAVRLALDAAGDRAMVFGTIGPIHGASRYGASLQADERQALEAEYLEQAEALLSAGVQGIILETFPDLEELVLALQVVRGITTLPIVTNLSPEEVGVTRDGIPLAQAFKRLREHGANVTGLNCRLGTYGILRSYEALSLEAGTYAAVPNSGVLHRSENDALSYTGDEDNFADVMVDIAQLGVTWLGGCCGTTPRHIRALVEKIQAIHGSPHAPLPRPESQGKRTASIHHVREPEVAVDDLIRQSGPSIVEMTRAKTTVIVELDPPKHLEIERFIHGARALRAAGADMITMADNSLGTIRVSNMALASILKQFGIEPLVHVTCRDRNLLGQQSHLMGLHVLGVRNILLITGDPTRYGDLPGATSVFDVSSMDLTKMVKRLNEGIGFSGKPLQRPAEFVIGTAFNPHVHNFQKAIDRLKRKVEAGADYVMTQPVYDAQMMEKIAAATRDLGVPVHIGIMPLTSLRNAEFIHHQIPGISIPDDVLTTMRNAAPDEASTVGYQIAQALVDSALAFFRGIYLVTPFLKYETTVQLTRYIRDTADVRSSLL